MITATYYTKEGLAEIFQTAQNASFMGIVSAYKPYRIINGKKQPLSEEENYYRHKFLGLMLNEKGIACASFCALSSRVSGDSSLESHTESPAVKTNTPQEKNKKENYEWYFYLVWGDNKEACSEASMEVERLGRACESAYYLASGGIMQGFTPKSAGGKPLKPYIGKKPLSAQRAINMMHRWFLDTSSDELLGLRFYQSIDNRSIRKRVRSSVASFHNIYALYHVLKRFDERAPVLDAAEYLQSDSKLMDSIAHKTLPHFMLREIMEEKSLICVNKSSSQVDYAGNLLESALPYVFGRLN